MATEETDWKAEAKKREDFWQPHREAFAAWVKKHNIGPGMNDRYRGKQPPPEGYTPPTNYTGFDGYVGLGWIPIIDRLATDLIAMGWDRDLNQIKEKFGGLRFYIGRGSQAMEDRIRQAELECDETCEYCGAPGKARGGGWIKTLCDRCDVSTKVAP